MKLGVLRTHCKSAITVALFIISLCCHTANVSAASPNSYFVAKTGNDSNPGSINSPFLTIKRCIQQMAAGDTCNIRSGTYDEQYNAVYGVAPHGTSFSNAITIKAYNGEVVTWKASYRNYVLNLQTEAYPAPRDFYWILDGIILDGAGGAEGVMGGLDANYVRIQNCEIKNAIGNGILPHSDYWEFLNLNVHNNGSSWQDHGLYWTGSHATVDGGSYHDNSGYGIHIFDSGSVTVSDNTVRNTRIYGNSQDGYTAGLILSAGSRNSAYNNIVYNNGPGREISIDYRCTDCTLYNNTIVPASGVTGIAINTNGSYVINTIIKNNIIYTSAAAIFDLGSGTIATNNLTTDPSFSNAAARDFTLKPTSSAIDAGVDLGQILSSDISGRQRPVGKGFDIGAYEYAPVTGDTTPPLVSITVVAP